MPKRGPHPRGGTTPRRSRPRPDPAPSTPGRGRVREPDLLGEVRGRLASGEPLDFLAHVSSLVAALDPRRDDPFDARGAAGRSRVRTEDLVGSFEQTEGPETTALLAGLAELAPGELTRARARRELRGRSDPLPTWLASLGESRVHRAVEMVHVLGDGDNVMLAVAFPDGQELSVVVYIDHNLGTLVKDAFVVTGTIDELVRLMRETNEDPDTAWNDIDLADARTRIAEAVELGDMTFPRFESDTWPACQPIVEWAIRNLPEGGAGYRRPEWDAAALEVLSEDFFASPHGRGLDDQVRRALLDAILWFGTDYGPGDPLRWSPVAVEILLVDWVPRKILIAPDDLALIPELLRGLVAYSHARRGLRPALTEETLAAVDRFEMEFQKLVRGPRPQVPLGSMAFAGLFGADGEDDQDDEDFDYATVARRMLERAVGGPGELAMLDAAPLPDEPFSWSEVPEDIVGRVEEVLALCDKCCDERLDVEYRTACRRLLARVATGDAGVFRRRGRADTAAAAVCWSVGKANGLFNPSAGRMRAKDLMEYFGVNQGSISQRAATLLAAAGVVAGPYGHPGSLGSPAFLVSARRRWIIDLRDRL